MEYEIAFIQALALTVIIECLSAAALKKFFGRRLGIEKISYLSLMTFVALASALTLPYVWFLLPAFVKHGLPYILTAEISVTIIEAAFYRFTLKNSILAALILSAILNFTSYMIGKAL